MWWQDTRTFRLGLAGWDKGVALWAGWRGQDGPMWLSRVLEGSGGPSLLPYSRAHGAASFWAVPSLRVFSVRMWGTLPTTFQGWGPQWRRLLSFRLREEHVLQKRCSWCLLSHSCPLALAVLVSELHDFHFPKVCVAFLGSHRTELM